MRLYVPERLGPCLEETVDELSFLLLPLSTGRGHCGSQNRE